MSEQQVPPNESKKPKQGRSPAYPGIAIDAAIEKSQALYKQEGKYPAPMSSAFKAWGYGEKSSGGREARAAMRYYGLISVEGDGETGKVKLTDDALRILLDTREDQTEKKSVIRRLALTPAIHMKLAEKYSEGLPSDSNIEHFLVFDEGFNPTAAKEVIAVFKETAAYAGIFEPVTIADKSSGGGGKAGSQDIRGTSGTRPPPDNQQRGKIMDGERVVFTEESDPQVYLKVVASGEVDELLLDALDDYVKRQRRRLASQATAKKSSDDSTSA
jgi:hypothetical protein